MAQDLELIMDLLREIKRANSDSDESLDKLLSSINSKIDSLERNSASADLIKSYLTDIVRSIENKYNTTADKFSDIEKALKAIFNSQDEHVKVHDMRELFDVFTQNLNNFYVETRQQKSIITGIESRIAEMSSNKSDKEEIVRTITLLRSDFENLNQGFKNNIDNVSSDLKSIISNLLKIDQSAVNIEIQNKVQDMYKATSDIANYLKSIDKHEAYLEQILLNTATAESLKFTQAVVDSILKKSEDISLRISDLHDELSTKAQFSVLVDKTDSLSEDTDSVKKELADITKNIEKLPDTAVLEESLKSVYDKVNDIDTALGLINTKGDVKDLLAKFTLISAEISTIKNIISDLTEIVNNKVIRTIEDISFEKESYDIKSHVSKMLSMLPQKEDIDRILENQEISRKSLEKVIEKTDDLADMLDKLPTQADMENLNSNQLSLVENLQGVANKDDINALSSQADDIEKMIDNLNFDNEFENLYDKSSSIEKWLEESKVKENSEEILSQITEKAEQKDVIDVLRTVETIADNIEELSQNVDVKKVNRTVSEVYQLIEDLKNDFINTTEMHNDTVVVHLSELQKSLSNIVTGDEFETFVEDLKSFVDKTVNDINTTNDNFELIKNYQESILTKLSEIDTNAIEGVIGKKVSDIDEKLITISDYISDNKASTEDVKTSVSEIKDMLSDKKSSISEIENFRKNTVSAIENYLKEVKVIIDTVQHPAYENIKSQIDDLEEKISTHHVSSENNLANILSKLEDYQTNIDEQQNSQLEDIKNSINEISKINEKIKEIGDSFDNVKSSDSQVENNVINFVSESLSEISQNLSELNDQVGVNVQTGFAYNAELIEEKASALLDLVKELRHENTQNIELYERLTVTDNKLLELQQSLEWLNSDFINHGNHQSEMLMKELLSLKEMLVSVSKSSEADEDASMREAFASLHNSISDDLEELTKYSHSTFNKLEASYSQITDSLSATENNLREFFIGDIDSVIRKIDSLKDYIEENIDNISVPNASNMDEYKIFTNQITQFKVSQKALLQEVIDDAQKAISDQIAAQHDELKSILTVAVNNEQIITAIDALKRCFKSRANDFEFEKDANTLVNFGSNEYDKAFGDDLNSRVISDLKDDFDKFAELINDLSGENREIKQVLNEIKLKLDNVTVTQTEVLPDIDITSTDADIVSSEDSELDEIAIPIDNIEDSDSDADTDVEPKSIIGAGNFDFVKAFDLLKNNLQKLNSNIEKVLPAVNISSVDESSILDTDSSSLEVLNGKLDMIIEAIQPKTWLSDIKSYIAGEDIHSMLNLINDKIDILAADDNTALIEDLRDAVEGLDDNKKTVDILNQINSKIDVLASTDSALDLDDIKYTLMDLDEKMDAVKDIKESDTIITSMLEDLNYKLDNLSSPNNKSSFNNQDLLDIKALISAQTEYIEGIEKNNKTDALKKCLQELTDEVNALNDTSATKVIQKTVRDMKESIMGAIVTIFDQVSFVEESEDIKDFVEEKTDEINKNLAEVTSQLKQITNADEEPDYSYSMQDIESDLAKMRLALNELQLNEQENSSVRLTSILENINQIGVSVENLENSLSQEEVFGLKSQFDTINNDIKSLNDLTNQLIVTSGESYNAITDDLSLKVDNVTRLIEKSNASDKVMRQALIYMGEWIDSASESMNRISTNSDEIIDIKESIEGLKVSIPEQTDLLNSIGVRFDEQQERLAYLEKQIVKMSNIEERFDEQQERIDRLEMSIEKILSAVEDIDDSRITRKIDKIEKQIAKLSTNIEKLAAYVD